MTSPKKVVPILAAGAVRGLFQSLAAPTFEAAALDYAGSFGAVGAMQEKLLAGEPCGLLVLTLPMLEKLATQGWVDAATITLIGSVGTGIAVRHGTPWPDVSTPHTLRANLRAAQGIHFPDPARATAGVHFANVLCQLGISADVAANCHHYPNGATAMAALAADTTARQIGCTQISEILYTPGVDLVAELPAPYQLSTRYAVALTASCRDSVSAHAMRELLTGSDSVGIRAAGGFQ
jgi:molybdate transport system substrate-binding protein